MASRWTIEMVDRSFRDILDIDEPFGGKVMVFGGDIRHVLPVIPKSTRDKTVNTSLVKSYLWQRMEKIKITRNMRARTDTSFSEFLLRIGNGEEPTIRDDLVLLPRQLVIETTSDSTGSDALIEFPGETRTFLSFDSAEDDTNNYYQEDYLNTLTRNSLPPHRLVLKKNVAIMLLRNLDASNGLCNGTRMICRGFDKNVIHAEIMMGQNAFKHMFIPRIQLSPSENEGSEDTQLL
ncbi:ATP-dependent DNA helicase PIF1-like [Capsicum annuum]|uniref:ATP-dependent DNA helicase PIF1-like n=1 Tax=Capsicum annuum TaxID=4072 RepID=UPI001FB0AE96|nr:ATP-dependent DNA helicase PIF1-like [Capsicum annuum]